MGIVFYTRVSYWGGDYIMELVAYILRHTFGVLLIIILFLLFVIGLLFLGIGFVLIEWVSYVYDKQLHILG